ncbi:hypothetical protein WKW65_05095 [Bradyrhizobium ottawaense]
MNTLGRIEEEPEGPEQDEIAQRADAVGEPGRFRIGRQQQGDKQRRAEDQQRERVELLDGRCEAGDENGCADQGAPQV